MAASGSLTLEYGGQTLSAYDVELSRKTGKPRAVGGARLLALEESGWVRDMKLEGYAPRRPGGPMALQEVPFPYLDVLQVQTVGPIRPSSRQQELHLL